ncbi:MAG: hypothetical protein ACRD21_15110 [Vicinamibacteria bacterium]
MDSSTRTQCVLACLATYILVAHRFWPMGLIMAVVPVIVVWLVTRRLIEQTRMIDSVVEEFVRRGGGDF